MSGGLINGQNVSELNYKNALGGVKSIVFVHFLSIITSY